MHDENEQAVVGGEEFIAFRVGEQEFCVEITSTREIRGWSQATRLPHSPDYIVGVINLRGTILPIMDLSARLGMGMSAPSERHVIIVVQVRDKTIGLLVDSVSDILDVGPDHLRPVPEVSSDMSTEMFNRVIVLDKRIICEICLESIMPEQEMQAA
ncbi:chemotaxis protein CheW [Oricola thermophila]|uniref:Purine-binding chemotaxis protein CheW n=1 Tax=Oricola thermophila TaxID=2742145 RepID=A0A6N1VK82_9HYPH|nr:chemotaxis protein CheW [Oricola thermophila]QKV19609.1 purine-binding chemotaxis protein CheW [Oricola thermophila]